jgi:hypothetical protein
MYCNKYYRYIFQTRHLVQTLCPEPIQAKTIPESIARNLLAHTRDQTRINPRFRSRVRSLESELQDLIVECDQGQNLANPDG